MLNPAVPNPLHELLVVQSREHVALATLNDRCPEGGPDPFGKLLSLGWVHHNCVNWVPLVNLQQHPLDEVGVQRVPVPWRSKNLGWTKQSELRIAHPKGNSCGRVVFPSNVQAKPNWGTNRNLLICLGRLPLSLRNSGIVTTGWKVACESTPVSQG